MVLRLKGLQGEHCKFRSVVSFCLKTMPTFVSNVGIVKFTSDGRRRVVNQRSVGKVAKLCQDQDSEARPALCAAVLPKRVWVVVNM